MRIESNHQALASGPGKHTTTEPGLFLLRGKKPFVGRWIVRVRTNNKLVDHTIGDLRGLTFDAACSRAGKLRMGEKLRPLDRTNITIHEPTREGVRTFREAAEEFIEVAMPRWRPGGKSPDQWRASLERYAYPVMGSTPVDRITVSHIEMVLGPIWATKAETANRVRARIEDVLKRETAKGFRDATNPADKQTVTHLFGVKHVGLKGRVADEQAKAQGRRGGFAAPSMDGLASYMLEAAFAASTSHRAMMFTAYTACREGMTLNATWHEIDVAGATWTVPGERMKAGLPFTIPLSTQALSILTGRPAKREGLLFPGREGKPLTNMALDQSVRRHVTSEGEKHWTPHGVRTTFRSWTLGQGRWPEELLERCLAHSVVESKVGLSYVDGDPTVERRRPIMQAWADEIERRVTQLALA